MITYRLKKRCGAHVCRDGHEINQEDPIYKTEEPLDEKWPDKFEKVHGKTEVEDHPFGSIITVDFPLAETIPQCVVWKKGRRYRITREGNLVKTDPPRMVNEDEVNLQLKKLLKSIAFGEADDDEELEEEDTEEDDEPVLVVKKKKRR